MLHLIILEENCQVRINRGSAGNLVSMLSFMIYFTTFYLYLTCFHFLAIMKYAVINMDTSFCVDILFLLYIFRSTVVRSNDNFMFDLSRNYQTLLLSSCIFTFSLAMYESANLCKGFYCEWFHILGQYF